MLPALAAGGGGCMRHRHCHVAEQTVWRSEFTAIRTASPCLSTAPCICSELHKPHLGIGGAISCHAQPAAGDEQYARITIDGKLHNITELEPKTW